MLPDRGAGLEIDRHWGLVRQCIRLTLHEEAKVRDLICDRTDRQEHEVGHQGKWCSNGTARWASAEVTR